MPRRKKLVLGIPIRTRLSPKDLIRFLKFVEVDDNGCWIWRGHCDKNGYGQFSIKHQSIWATRVSYTNFKARLMLGRDVHHTKKCKSHSCVNPDHLAQRTRLSNSSDGGKRRSRQVKDDIPF